MRQTPRPRHSCDEATQAILGVEGRCDVNVSVTDSVRGLNEKDVAGFAAEAESGFDLAGRPVEPNPHLPGMQIVPQDLAAAVEERARREGRTSEEVVRQALECYLRSA